jgi:carboxypeptidase PM20D1
MDDKGALIAVFEALESLLAAGFEPGATLYVVVGHDEEVGGGDGAAAVARLLAERGVRVDFVLDEGDGVAIDLLPGMSCPVALLGIGEKGYLDLELVADDPGGHSSIPPRHTAVGRLAAALVALEGHPMPARLDVNKGFFLAVAGHLSAPMRLALRNVDRVGRLVERQLAALPETDALIRTTMAATMVEGGTQPNVLPRRARAVVNVRVMPGDTPEEVVAHVRSVAGERIAVRRVEGGFTPRPSPLSDPDSASFRLIEWAIRGEFGEIPVAPWILTGATDSRHFASIADDVYRFTPFRTSPAEMRRVHGTGERVRLDDADKAVGFYRAVVREACAGD